MKMMIRAAIALLALSLCAPAEAQSPDDPNNKSIIAPAGWVPVQGTAFAGPNGKSKVVSADTPMPIGGGAPGAPATATISSGGSLSAAVDLEAGRLHRIAIPSTWTAAAITFQSSSTGVTFNDLYDFNGEVTLSSAVVGASRSIVVDQAVFYGIRYLKIRSGTSAAPVNQAADRTVSLVTVPR